LKVFTEVAKFSTHDGFNYPTTFSSRSFYSTTLVISSNQLKGRQKFSVLIRANSTIILHLRPYTYTHVRFLEFFSLLIVSDRSPIIDARCFILIFKCR